MDFNEIKNATEWFFALLATSGIALILGLFNIIKSGKMLPRDIKKADLDNKSKEISIADQFNKLATDAAERALKLQEKIDMLESASVSLQSNFTSLNSDYALLKDMVEAQETVIGEQAIIIEEQSKRLDLQDAKIIEQQEEIETLKCELDNTRQYNEALIKQMRDAHIIPVDVKSISQKRCKDNSKKS